MLKIKTHERAP